MKSGSPSSATKPARALPAALFGFRVSATALSLAILLYPAAAGSAFSPPGRAFSAAVERLENGLAAVLVPLDNPGVIAFHVIVRSGSKSDVEPGRSGFAHLFEHLTRIGGGGSAAPLARLGAVTDGVAAEDYTGFSVVFSGRENLETVIRIEADRLINLEFTEAALKAEAGVIESEFKARASDPDLRMDELLRRTAYELHPYKDTVLGVLPDIRDMADPYEYSRLYKKRFYAPDNTVLLIAGDFDPDKLKTLIRSYFGGWAKSDYAPPPLIEPPQKEPRRAHLPWPSPTLPRLAIAYHGPAFSDETIDKAALDILAALAFSPSSELYGRLVRQEQKCAGLGASFPDHRDPSLLVFNAAVKSAADLPYVENEILKELDRWKTGSVPARALADAKAHRRYAQAFVLGTTEGVASALAFILNLTGNPGTFDKLNLLADKVTSADIRAAAQKYFRTSNSTTVTLARETPPPVPEIKNQAGAGGR